VLNKSRGRPRGNPPTKARIVEAARELFLRHGYRGTTVRAVAAKAGVDSALISYHFGSKQGLFSESIRVQCTRSLALTKALEGEPAGLADRLLRAVTDLWEDPDAGRPSAEVNLLALHDEDVTRVLREYLEYELIRRLAEYLGGPDATERATAAVTLIGGLIFTRYLSPLYTPASMSAADMRRILRLPLRAALYGAGQSRNPVQTESALPAFRG
jgi:AcrR family transcriptional regulator